MAVTLGSKAVGSIIKIKVNGEYRNFIVVNQGRPSTLYDVSCDGTWLLMEDVYEERQWHNTSDNQYASSDIFNYINNTFLNLFDTNIRNLIVQVRIPYAAGNATDTIYSGNNGLLGKIFLLSCYEVGYTKENFINDICEDGAKLSYFLEGNKDYSSEASLKRIGYLNNKATSWWLRSPRTQYSTVSCGVYSNGNANIQNASYIWGVRPAFILPSSLMVQDDGTINTAPTAPSSITLPDTIKSGVTFPVSWTESTDAEGNLEGYVLERSTNGGSTWTQRYRGMQNSTTDSIPYGTATVQYRVKAYDTEGLESGWFVSGSRTVVNNTAPTAPPSITVPMTVTGGENLTVSWIAASDAENNLEGYILERQYDGGSYAQIYKGAGLSFTDSITRGWTSVRYRVKAYDSYGEESSYTTGDTRTVDNNAPPVITCNITGDMGAQSEGFTIPYSVADPDGDGVTVTEAVDNVVKRVYSPVQGTENTFEITGEYFMKLLNGAHTITITATDTGGKSAVHTITFTKAVHKLSIMPATPMAVESQVTKALLTVMRSIPEDAAFKVEITNNANDPTPVWEDVTNNVLLGRNCLFANETATNGFAFSFRITAERAEGGEGGYISTVMGAFE